MTPFSSILYLPAVSFIFILTDSNIESSIHTIWQCQLAKGSAQLCKLQEKRRCNLTQRWWRSRRCSYVESSLCFLGLVFNGYPCPVYCQYYYQYTASITGYILIKLLFRSIFMGNTLISAFPPPGPAHQPHQQDGGGGASHHRVPGWPQPKGSQHQD